jgi:hypothetical protein
MNAFTKADIAITATIGPWEPPWITDQTNKPESILNGSVK